MRSQQQRIPVNVEPGMYPVYLDLDLLVIQSCLTLCDPKDSSPPVNEQLKYNQIMHAERTRSAEIAASLGSINTRELAVQIRCPRSRHQSRALLRALF